MSDGKSPRYSWPLRGLHWLMTAVILLAAGMGVWALYTPHEDPLREGLLLVHKSLGVTLLALAILRALIRVVGGTPAYNPPLGRGNELIAGAAHALLYFAMIALPLTGYVHAMAGKHEFALFGRWPVPNYVPASETLAAAAGFAHYALALLLGALVVLHVLAALWHKLIRDGVYERMWPSVSVSS